MLQYLKKAKSLLEEEEKMDELTLINKIQKILKERYQQVGDTMVSGGVDNMEKYKYMLGQAHAYQLILQEISNLLEEKEQKDEQGTVIKLGQRSTEN